MKLGLSISLIYMKTQLMSARRRRMPLERDDIGDRSVSSPPPRLPRDQYHYDWSGEETILLSGGKEDWETDGETRRMGNKCRRRRGGQCCRSRPPSPSLSSPARRRGVRAETHNHKPHNTVYSHANNGPATKNSGNRGTARFSAAATAVEPSGRPCRD